GEESQRRCAAPVGAGMPLEGGMAEETGVVAAGAVLAADWPAPPGVHAFTTLRHGAGVSLPPFDSFNLGARSGDDPAAVAANREQLRQRLRLPSHPYWLRSEEHTSALQSRANLVCRL